MYNGVHGPAGGGWGHAGAAAAGGGAAFLADFVREMDEMGSVATKEVVNALTMIAADNASRAADIVGAIEARVRSAPGPNRLALLYLLDSIIKNLGGAFREAASRNIVQTFTSAFDASTEANRAAMDRVLQTWESNTVFAPPLMTVLRQHVKRANAEAAAAAAANYAAQQAAQQATIQAQAAAQAASYAPASAAWPAAGGGPPAAKRPRPEVMYASAGYGAAAPAPQGAPGGAWPGAPAAPAGWGQPAHAHPHAGGPGPGYGHYPQFQQHPMHPHARGPPGYGYGAGPAQGWPGVHPGAQGPPRGYPGAGAPFGARPPMGGFARPPRGFAAAAHAPMRPAAPRPVAPPVVDPAVEAERERERAEKRRKMAAAEAEESEMLQELEARKRAEEAERLKKVPLPPAAQAAAAAAATRAAPPPPPPQGGVVNNPESIAAIKPATAPVAPAMSAAPAPVAPVQPVAPARAVANVAPRGPQLPVPPTGAAPAPFVPDTRHLTELTPQSLNESDPTTVTALYAGLKHRCTSCGLRYGDKTELSKHMDWHFEENRRVKAGLVRSWFAKEEEWGDPETMQRTLKEKKSFFDEQTAAAAAAVPEVVEDPTKFVVLTSVANSTSCDVCGQALTKEWSDDEEDWVFVNALNTATGTEHKTCQGAATPSGK